MNKPLSFFLPMIPPTVTHQEKKVTVIDGRPIFYEPPELKDARQKLSAYLAPYAPKQPFKKALRLIVKWCFPITGTHTNGEYKTSKPDTDNLQKLLKDVMTAVGFWRDDALVCSEIVEKFHAERTGIYIMLMELNQNDEVMK